MMQGKLSQARLAFLWDHQVSGRALFPAAAMLEAGSAAICAALGTSSNAHPAVLTEIAIPAPLQLPPSSFQLPLIKAVVDLANAALSIESARLGSDRSLHMRGSIALAVQCLCAPPAASVNGGEGAAVLARTQAFSPKQSLPAAFGEVTQRKALQADEYIIDPAVIDNATQVCFYQISYMLYCTTQ